MVINLKKIPRMVNWDTQLALHHVNAAEGWLGLRLPGILRSGARRLSPLSSEWGSQLSVFGC